MPLSNVASIVFPENVESPLVTVRRPPVSSGERLIEKHGSCRSSMSNVRRDSVSHGTHLSEWALQDLPRITKTSAPNHPAGQLVD